MPIGASRRIGPKRVDTEFHPYIMHLFGFILNRRQTGYPV